MRATVLAALLLISIGCGSPTNSHVMKVQDEQVDGPKIDFCDPDTFQEGMEIKNCQPMEPVVCADSYSFPQYQQRCKSQI